VIGVKIIEPVLVLAAVRLLVLLAPQIANAALAIYCWITATISALMLPSILAAQAMQSLSLATLATFGVKIPILTNAFKDTLHSLVIIPLREKIIYPAHLQTPLFYAVYVTHRQATYSSPEPPSAYSAQL
jgi:hypothetical protein